MRTGNVVLDMVIAMSIPIALQWLRKQWEWLGPCVKNFLFRARQKEERYTRSIDYEKVSAFILTVDSEDRCVLRQRYVALPVRTFF